MSPSRKPRRTAVVFVHGQGDQAPMDDLLKLAHSVWETEPRGATDKPRKLVSTPPAAEENADLRRLITEVVDDRQIHFHQFYWAHLMVGNTIGDVFVWLLRLLRRPLAETPRPLRAIRATLYVVIWILALTAITQTVFLATRLLTPPDQFGAWLPNGYVVLWGLCAFILVSLLIHILPGRSEPRTVGRLAVLSTSSLVLALVFSLMMPSIIPGSVRVLKGNRGAPTALGHEHAAWVLPSDSLWIAVACRVDTNPQPSSGRNYCEARGWLQAEKINPVDCPKILAANAASKSPANQAAWAKWRHALAANCAAIEQPFTVWHLISALQNGATAAVLLVGLMLALLAGRTPYFLQNVMADSARYFSNDPRNVAQRDKIRSEGVALLRDLHESGLYDRIVVVAHSLGSAVSYGMLDHYWGEVHAKLSLSSSGEAPVLKQVTAAAKSLLELWDGLDEKARARAMAYPAFRQRLAAYRLAQREYSRALASEGHWLVSDFVTLGSPLTYARLLMADSNAEFENKLRARQRLAGAPPAAPELTDKGHTPPNYGFTDGWIGEAVDAASNAERASGQLPPWHSAVFAATRWTNIFFGTHLVYIGDIVGGPVAPVFGPGVADIRLKPDRWEFLHNDYWLGADQRRRGPADDYPTARPDPKPPPHILRLRQALNLLERGEAERALLDLEPPLA